MYKRPYSLKSEGDFFTQLVYTGLENQPININKSKKLCFDYFNQRVVSNFDRQEILRLIRDENVMAFIHIK